MNRGSAKSIGLSVVAEACLGSAGVHHNPEGAAHTSSTTARTGSGSCGEAAEFGGCYSEVAAADIYLSGFCFISAIVHLCSNVICEDNCADRATHTGAAATGKTHRARNRYIGGIG